MADFEVPSPHQPTWRVRLYRILGVGLFLVNTVGSSYLAARWTHPAAPFVAGGAHLLTWYIGKLLGIPIDGILAAALAKKSPAEMAQIAVQAIQSMPVEQINPVARAVYRSVRPVAMSRISESTIPPAPRVPFDIEPLTGPELDPETEHNPDHS